MASTTISDAVVFPQDDGTGVSDGDESYDSGGYYGTIAQSTGAEFKLGLELTNLDTGNDAVTVKSGVAFIKESGNTVQSGAQQTYDTTLPEDMMYVVVLPSSTTVSLATDTAADVHLVIDPTSQDSVTVQHNTSPTNPSLVIGNADSSSGGEALERNPGPITEPRRVNGTRIAYPGDVQPTIDRAAAEPNVGIGFDQARAKVELVSGEQYEIGNQGGTVADVHVKPGVMLQGNGAVLTNSTDGVDKNAVFFDNGSEFAGELRIGIDGANYTSDAVLFDSDQSQEGKYGMGGAGAPVDSQAHMRNGHISVIGDASSAAGGNGVAFRGSEAVAIGSNFDMTVFRMENGILNANTDFANMDTSYITTVGCVNAVHSVSTADQMRTPIMGIHQPAAASERVYWNESGNAMPINLGAVWDPSNASTNALVGSNIILKQLIQTSNSWDTDSDGSNPQFIEQHAGALSGIRSFAVPGVGAFWGQDPGGGFWAMKDLSANQDWIRLGQADEIRSMVGGFQATVNGEGITSRSPDGNTITTWNTQDDGSWG